MTRTAAQIRREFIDFFVSKHGHAFVPSSPVVPHDDPTLLFTNAGMNQFKPYFLGTETARVTRVANTQKCIRAGGKHNDLDDVGHDTYHHTFFEMLGNWSFGDYFKAEAIEWAWELLTKVWGLDGSRLHATYFQGDSAEGLEPDTEARDLWLKILPPKRVHPGNKKDNFWEMGDTGPCGPCSEIHVDLTPDGSGGELVNAGDARVMEIWNLVFIQFNRGGDGKLTPLPAKHVDTGMGFERVTSLLQGKKSNYDTDVFAPIFAAIQRVTGAPAYTALLETSDTQRDAHDSKRSDNDAASKAHVMKDIAYRVIADHLRCLTFAITDGAMPSNEGRGFVLRRILRRAVRYGRQYLLHSVSSEERATSREERAGSSSTPAGGVRPFMCELVPAVAEAMGEAFPELLKAHGGKNVEHVAAILREEEESFGRTLDRGIALFCEAADRARGHHHGRIAGEDAFKLHDTYGFPIDLTELMAEEQGLTVDIGEYERRMEEARERARHGNDADDNQIPEQLIQALRRDIRKTNDEAKYDPASLQLTTDLPRLPAVLVILKKNIPVDEITEGERGAIMLNLTNFYSEQGGQVGDTGLLNTINQDRGLTGSFQVEDTQSRSGFVFHLGTMVKGTLRVESKLGSLIRPVPDEHRRGSIASNHSSTHLLNWALREVLGEHIQQKGSLVDSEKTRFDFSHPAAVTADELKRIEALVNQRIEEKLPVYAKEEDQKLAMKINGLRAVFGEKYPERVRIVSIGVPVEKLMENPENAEWRKYSIEFCGGTHVKSTDEAEHFRLIEESAVARGVRRVTGITGERAMAAERRADELREQLGAASALEGADLVARVSELSHRVETDELPVLDRSSLREKLAALQERVKAFEKTQAKARTGDLLGRVDALVADAPRAGGVAIIAADMGEAGPDDLRVACDALRAKAGSAAILLAARQEGKVVLMAAMTADVVKKGVKAGDIIKEIAPLVGGKGGGRPDMAQGGGPEVGGIAEALTRSISLIKTKLGG